MGIGIERHIVSSPKKYVKHVLAVCNFYALLACQHNFLQSK